MSKTAQRRLCTVLLAANLALIWGNSLMPGDTSGEMSGWVMKLLAFLPQSEMTHTVIRKLAHFSEFACLGVLIGWFCVTGKTRIQPLLVGVGLAAACVDETIQIYSAGRASSLIDVWIDTAGFTTGLLIFWLIHRAVKNRKKPVAD